MDQPAGSWQTFLEHAEISDVGLRRSNNQDSLSFQLAPGEKEWRRRGHLFMVADGMGAHAAGELASKIATDTVPLTYFKLAEESPVTALRKSIEDANKKIHDRGQANPDFKGMGTTSSVLLLLPQGALVGHVGDSRVYRLRGDRIEQLSFDHSLVWEMKAAGRMQDSPGFIPKNIITRSLGPSDLVQVDVEGPFPLVEGDTFLLCSDGLSGQVDDEEIGVILRTLPPAEAVQVLVDLANLRGGPDNITVIVVRVGSLKGLPNASSMPRIVVGSAPPRSSMHWGWLLAPVVAALVAGFLFMVQANLAAAVVGGFAGLSLLVIGLAGLFGSSGASRLPEGAKLGNGPHAAANCQPNATFVERLQRVVRELSDAARQQEWIVDWSSFNQLVEQTEAFARQNRHQEAIQCSCRAISLLMRQLRNQRSRRNGD